MSLIECLGFNRVLGMKLVQNANPTYIQHLQQPIVNLNAVFSWRCF
jgi:hypothetical protein